MISVAKATTSSRRRLLKSKYKINDQKTYQSFFFFRIDCETKSFPGFCQSPEYCGRQLLADRLFSLPKRSRNAGTSVIHRQGKQFSCDIGAPWLDTQLCIILTSIIKRRSTLQTLHFRQFTLIFSPPSFPTPVGVLIPLFLADIARSQFPLSRLPPSL